MNTPIEELKKMTDEWATLIAEEQDLILMEVHAKRAWEDAELARGKVSQQIRVLDRRISMGF